MIIDGHAHGCGSYFNEKRILKELEKQNIDMVVLCPGEANSKRNYIYPMLCRLSKSNDKKNIMYENIEYHSLTFIHSSVILTLGGKIFLVSRKDY